MSDELEGLTAPETTVEPTVEAAAPEIGHVATDNTPASPPNILSLAEQRGYRFKDETEIIDAIDRLAANMQQIAPYADFGKNAVPVWNEFEEWRKSKEAAAQKANEPAKPQSAWAPPQLNSLELETYFTKDPATGRYTAKAGIPPEVARKAAEWDAYTGRHIYNFRTNPIESLKNLGYAQKEEILSEMKAYLKQEKEREQFEYIKQSTLEDLKPLIIDKNTGRLNAYGIRLTEVVNDLEAQGMTHPPTVAAYAKRIVDSEQFARQAAARDADIAVRNAAGMPTVPGGPAAQNQPSRQPPATRPDAPAPHGMGLHQLLKQTDPNFNFSEMRKDLLGF